MKKNILNTMKQFAKYICAVVVLLGMSVSAWGTGATTLNPGNLKITTSEQTDKCFVGDVLVDYVTVGTYDSKLTIKKDATIQNITPVAGKITSIVVSAPTYSGATSGNFVIYGGVTAGAKTTAIYSGTSTSEITADFSSYNYQYFYIENNTERQVTTASIVINYSGTESGNLIVYPNIFEIEGELDDGVFSASRQGKFYINTDVLADEYSYYDEEITSGDDEHCAVDAYGSDDYDGYSYTNNFYLNVWADAAGTYEATVTITGYDLAWKNELSTTLTVTVIVTAPCIPRSITMSNFSKDFGSADFVPTHTVSAGSGTKTWTSSNTDVATIVDGKVHIVAAGTTTIGLSVAADDPYCAVSKNCTMTVNALVPTVTAFTGTSTTPTSITLTNAQVSNKGGAAITAYGYIYSTTASTTEALKLGESGVSTATVASADIAASTNFASKTVSELTTGTTYYIRAYATNSAGTGYSAVQSVKTIAYTDYKFSCADWSLTGPSGDIVFITSAASKTVRSQEAFHVSGSGLPHNTALTFTTFPVNTKFEFKKADGTIPQTNEFGVVDADVYAFYTPDAGDTSDGLDELTSLTVSVTGEPRTATIDTKRIIGRHLPADFVIAVKRNNKWYALPDTMTALRHPKPIEIAVDDADNPTIAYSVTTNYYKLYGQSSSTIASEPGKLYSNGEMIKLGMTTNGTANAPLFGSATGSTTIGQSGSATITNNIGKQYWWKLKQTNKSISNATDAKYRIYSANNTSSLSLRDNAGKPDWGLFASGVEELRLIPVSPVSIVFEVAEASVVEWGQHKAIVEFDNSRMIAHYAKATLNNVTVENIALNQTRTSVLSGTTKYNYTMDFGSIDFAASTSNGATLLIQWYDILDNLVGASNITVPKIIAADATMGTVTTNEAYWNTEVHVLPGVTLTADGASFSSSDVTIKDLQIYPGATLKVTTGTLDVTNLSLRNGWRRVNVAKPTYDVARLQIKADANLTHTYAYLDWYIDNDQYYPVAVPFPVTVDDITYLNTKNSVTIGGVDGVIRLRYFDGANRAAGKSGNWKYYGEPESLPVPDKLLPSMGYAMAAKRPGGKAFSILRMPLIYTDEWTALGEQASVEIEAKTYRKDTVHVYAYGNDKTAEWNKGWNLIGNPYMAVFHGDDREEGIYGKILAVSKVNEEGGEKLRYVTIPNSSFTDYAQVQYKDTLLKPSSSFLVQVKDTGRLEFSNSKIDKPTAPARYTATPTKAPEQEAYIRLSYEGGSDQMGLIIGEDYTAAYETNADLMKMLGEEQNTLKTYMMYNDVEMAYVAINEDLASEWIPITVRIPETGEYTYSLTRASEIDNLEGVYLIDYETNTVTNLIESNYSFVADEGTIDDRFAINAIVGRHETPTDIDIINAGGDVKSDKPVKFIYNDKVFILHSGVIYDSSGKKVREINR